MLPRFSFRLPHLHLCPFHFSTLASLCTASSLLLPPSAILNTVQRSTVPAKDTGRLRDGKLFLRYVGSDLFWDSRSQELAVNTSQRCTTACFAAYFWQLRLLRYPTVSHKLTNSAPTFRAAVFPFNKMALRGNCIHITCWRVSVDSLWDSQKPVSYICESQLSQCCT